MNKIHPIIRLIMAGSLTATLGFGCSDADTGDITSPTNPVEVADDDNNPTSQDAPNNVEGDAPGAADPGDPASDDPGTTPVSPADAPVVAVDRFATGALFNRAGNPNLPAANAPINFDEAPFITRGLGPAGEVAYYYNFDVQPTAPAPIYVLFREGAEAPLEGQGNIIDVIPGDEGYNDFWIVNRVNVPADYVANTATSMEDIAASGFEVVDTGILVNCPVVPAGSTAALRNGDASADAVIGWYKGQGVHYFEFEAGENVPGTAAGVVPSPIFVMFGNNEQGPSSGFRTVEGTNQTHNVLATLPGQDGYSPLWAVSILNNEAFDSVTDLPTALTAAGDPALLLEGDGPNVNCPVVKIEEAGPPPPTAVAAVAVDRFADGALFNRAGNPALPAANAPINFDQKPFLTKGFGPNGEVALYYNFDVQPQAPAPIWVFFREGENTPLAGQGNIIDVIPGEVGYNDFWLVNRVDVPADYVANTVTSAEAVVAAGFTVTPTDIIVNCPVVPAGSTASFRNGAGNADAVVGWYKGQGVHYFEFSEKALTGPAVPTSPIFVQFAGNDPAMGFMEEPGGAGQTHNVLGTLPADDTYSPLWKVTVLDSAGFDAVSNLATAEAATVADPNGPLVNCPVVNIGGDAPALAPVVEVDRFANGALFNRAASPTLPAANAPINFDEAPFITNGLGPAGESSFYYNFDVQTKTPAPIWVLFREGEDAPVPGQGNIIDVLPGEVGYNDFWLVNRVDVPADYVPNTVTSAAEVVAAGYTVTPTTDIVNCPVVPAGSTAALRNGGGNADPVIGWHKGQAVHYFVFGEALTGPVVPESPIFVMFNDETDIPGSGFVVEPNTSQTHNVLATLPGQDLYSPLWKVTILSNAAFPTVTDLASASQAATDPAMVVEPDGPLVNCPVVDAPAP